MTLENRMKIEGAMSKNVRSSIFQKNLAKTSGGYFGANKVDFFYSKSKNGYSPMDSSSFRVKKPKSESVISCLQDLCLIVKPKA